MLIIGVILLIVMTIVSFMSGWTCGKMSMVKGQTSQWHVTLGRDHVGDTAVKIQRQNKQVIVQRDVRSPAGIVEATDKAQELAIEMNARGIQ